MCSVAAVGIISIGTQIVGGIMSANAQSKSADANAEYLESQADTSEEQAEKILDAAEIQQEYMVTSAAKESQRRRNEFKKTLGTQKVVFASNGIGSGSATAMDVSLDSLNRSAEDEDLIRYNANVAANELFRGSEFQADQLKTQTKHYRTAALNERSSKSDNFFANILGTASNTAGSVYQLSSMRGK